MLTVFNQRYNCQTSHYLGRNQLPKSFLTLPSLVEINAKVFDSPTTNEKKESSKNFCIRIIYLTHFVTIILSSILILISKKFRNIIILVLDSFFEMGWKSHQIPVLCRTLIFEWIAVKNDIKANNFAMWQTFMWRRVEDEKGRWNRGCGLGGQWGSLQPKPGFRNCEP